MSLQQTNNLDFNYFKRANMKIKRTYKGKGSKGWTGIDNKSVIYNKYLSAEARLCLIAILSIKESDKLTQDLIMDLTGLSKVTVNNSFKELEYHNYLKISKMRVYGRFETDYEIDEDPKVKRITKYQKTPISKKKKPTYNSVSTGSPGIENQPGSTVHGDTDPGNYTLSYNTKENNTNPINPLKNSEIKKEIVREGENIFSFEQKQLGKKLKDWKPKDEKWTETIKDLLTNFPLETLKNWEEARSFYPENINSFTWYFENSIRTGKGLPSEYLKEKNNKIRSSLFDTWQQVLISSGFTTTSKNNIESNAGLFSGKLLKALETMKKYNDTKLIDEKEKLITDSEDAIKFLQTVLRTGININSLRDLITFYISTPARNNDKFLRTIKPEDLNHWLNLINMIRFYSEVIL